MPIVQSTTYSSQTVGSFRRWQSIRTAVSSRGQRSVACNGAHSLKQRLARWLLMMRDRGDDDVLQITQELLAEMLGVQRPSISNAARELERAGLIWRARRHVP